MTQLHHAGVCVRDLDTSMRFYVDGLELQVLVDTVLTNDLEPLLGVTTEEVRFVFLGSSDNPDSGIVELIDLGLPAIADGQPQQGLPARGVFLLSVQVDVDAVLSRLAELGLGGTPRTFITPTGATAATVVDPDGVMVELLPLTPLSVMQ